MWHLAALCVSLLCISQSVSQRQHFSLTLDSYREDPRTAFREWAEFYGKSYSGELSADSEAIQRFSYWEENVNHLVRQSNAASVELNGLMDLHDTEFSKSLLGHTTENRPSRCARLYERPIDLVDHLTNNTFSCRKPSTGKAHLEYRYRFVQPADAVDWRLKGIVGPIKNQHVNGSKCGCCWSFATIATVESINALATGKMEVLSEQQLIACDQAAPYYDLGCQGGDFEGGMKYIIDNGGIALEDDYRYLAEDSKCNHRKVTHRAVTIDAVEDVPGGNETALMQAVTMHPTAIGLCVGPWIKEWRAYTGGILKVPENCEEPQDHAMPVVGYGKEASGEEYWILKNSWGSDWGEAGFLRLPKGMPGNGSLGLAANPGYPVKISANPHAEPAKPAGALSDILSSVLGRSGLHSVSV